MSYRMIYELQRLMCDKFSVLCTLKELHERDEKQGEVKEAEDGEA